MAELQLPSGRDLYGMVEGPFVVTFTAHLPFTEGIPNDLGHHIAFNVPFVDERAKTTFGNRVFVRIRVFDAPGAGLMTFLDGFHRVIQHFYDVQLPKQDQQLSEQQVSTAEQLPEHDRWFTLETPYALAEGESPADKPFALHRCLYAFNMFLRAVTIITKDIRVRTISTQDLRPVVLVGALPIKQKWMELFLLLMHPEALSDQVVTADKPFNDADLESAIEAIASNQPYLTTLLWRSRAQPALIHRGDAADAIISFQIAAESMLFDTYRMILIDEGCSAAEIADLLTDVPFKTLLTNTSQRSSAASGTLPCQEHM